ncbi:metal-dependent transcriptional regulator [Methanococcus voltae]|uniref:DtxR family Mn-dependent transcriptional regulator n=2 Tax=Methanococcus voltae TaxID=2188 RepID=A0A8J7UTV5_METVO|nr:metal-dependent transcriptional regulator [Methanococcus voltae]MBP2173135.1 DtxR family Mn-dependent transcriptional regulator [Methanococcus voltae]MBP2202073.1 DtxR family Mn-dependent transcriptional regulator [Methanococcus voltae]MCS3922838.1 DtxR family Mn-dependent transcriptional regulator [Methanococcus voltae PS]
MVSPNIEDYLEHIHIFTRKEQRPVKTTELANLLGVKPAAVTGMAKKLSSEGYIIYEPYVGIKLDEKGELIARKILRKHLIIEHFLVDCLGVDLKDACNEACKLEHSMSDDTIERLYVYMKKPATCPHGEKIEKAFPDEKNKE